MLEQVCSLGIDLERVFLIQQVQIEPLTAHSMIVLQTTTSSPKLRPIGQAIPGFTWGFTVVAGCRSGYVNVSGIGAPMSSKACRWVLVGSASIAMVTWVPVYCTWLRVKVARCSSRPRKLW